MGVEGEGAVALSRYASLSLGMLLCAVGLRAQDTAAVHVTKDSLTVRFVQADIRAVIQALGRYLPKPVLVTNIPPVPVSLETPTPVPRAAVPALLKGLVESQSLELTEDSTYFRVAPRPAEGARPSAGPLTRPGRRSTFCSVLVVSFRAVRGFRRGRFRTSCGATWSHRWVHHRPQLPLLVRLCGHPPSRAPSRSSRTN